MTRNLKALGLALVAVFAMSAFAASSASAVDVFTVEGGSKHVTGTDHVNIVFEITGAGVAVECANSVFTGTVENGASEVEMEATYSGTIGEPETEHCSSSIGEQNVETNGCAFILTGDTTGEDVSQPDATLWIECPTNEEITLVTPDFLTLHIPPQTPTSGGVAYTNASGENLLIEFTATGLTYTCTPHFLCTLSGTPTAGNDMQLTGAILASDLTYSQG